MDNKVYYPCGIMVKEWQVTNKYQEESDPNKGAAGLQIERSGTFGSHYIRHGKTLPLRSYQSGIKVIFAHFMHVKVKAFNQGDGASLLKEYDRMHGSIQRK
jgi:hypothetical protein